MCKGSIQQLIQALTPMGLPKYLGSQIKYNCPQCENELGMDPDKYNLEINFAKQAFKCWACGQHGSIYTLIKKYGHKEFLSLFKGTKNEIVEEKQSEILVLPANLVSIFSIKEAYDYLLSRGLTKEQIKERDIKYCYEGEYKNCIIFPSYDSEKKLNAFVSHNLSTKKYKKKKNKDFKCFYESFIDKRSLIIITEGVYDSLVIPNGLPLLGLEINEELLDFLSECNVLLIIDNDVDETVRNTLIEKIQAVCIIRNHSINTDYKDLNEYHINDKENLREEIKIYYTN